MSGKKAQRTKGNTQPSSSSRSAKFLQHEGQPGLITFTGLAAGNTTASQEIGDHSSLDAEMRLLLRKMAKKDTTTKLKAVQEFTLLCKEKDAEAVKNILTFWPRMYGKLAHDFDHRVREATQQAHYQLTTKAGRSLAPQLKQIVVNWLMSLFDNHVPAANSAKMSFDQVFAQKKRKEVLVFCKKEIVGACEKNVLRETADTLSDPKVVPLEEREAKYHRFVSSTLLVLKYLLENMETSEYDDEEFKEKLTIIFADKKFWKFAKHDSPMIRTSFFTLLLTLCEKLTSTMEESLQHVSTAVLTNLDEQDPVVTKALWDCLLYSLSTFNNLWEFVNVRKAVWPKLWKLLNSGCYGNLNIVYPNLLPFVNHITPEVAGDGTGFYAEFFDHIAEILVVKKNVLPENDSTLVIVTYMECIRFVLVKHTKNKEVSEFIIGKLIAGKLREIFHSTEEYYVSCRIFIKELQSLLSHLYNKVTKNNENSEYFKILYADLWAVVGDVIFTQSGDDDDIKFKFTESESITNSNGIKANFYTSLLDFLSYSFKNSPVRNVSDCAVYNESDREEHFSVLLRKITKCFVVEIFGGKQWSDGEQLMKLISLAFNIDLIRCVCVEKLNWENNEHILEEASNLDVCKTFVNSIVLPLLASNVCYEKQIVKVTVGLVTLLHGADKQDYLVSLFEEDIFSGFVLLASFVEVFCYCTDEYVLNWLKSDFVEKEVTKLCSSEKEVMKLCYSEKDNEPDEHTILTWEILGMYIQVVQENAEKLALYHNNLLVLIKDSITKASLSSQTIDDSIFTTFSSLCTSSLQVSPKLLDTLFNVFRYNVLQDETSSSVDALNNGFAMLMHPQHNVHFKETVKTFLEFAKDSCSDGSICSKLCRTIFSLIEIAQNHSDANSEVSYGKIMFHKIISTGENYLASSNMFKFYSQLLKVLSLEDTALLEYSSDTKLYNVIFQSFAVAMQESDAEARNNIEVCIKTSTFLHFNLLDDAVHRCLRGNVETAIVKKLLKTFVQNEQLTEPIVDHILMLTSPSKHDYTDVACDTYCMVVSIVDDISCTRALVEMYVDELRNNADITNNSAIFGQFVKVLSAVICRWYEILSSFEASDLTDYFDVIDDIITCIVKWKEDHSEMVLFSCSLVDAADAPTISLNIHLIQLVHQCVKTSLEVFKPEQWDFLLCSMISWMQSCEESLECFNCIGVQRLYPQFMHATFHLFNTIALVFDSNRASTDPYIAVPSIYLEEASMQNVPTVNEDTVTEWKELFLPTAGTSLLRIYMYIMKKDSLDNKYTELEQSLCTCIRFIPPFTIHEFACSGNESDDEKQKAIEEFCDVCCRVLASGSWWNKIGSYQLLTGLGELIESKLCYISQQEDEEHEGMRSFPPPLIQTMENSRDETLKVLSAEGVSIKDPLKSFEHRKGKSDLLTYLLSWQVILQLFKIADPSNRALFANYFHSNSDVHDLVTCLFCLMSQSMNPEYNKTVTMLNFTFTEIRHVAFHLLTTSMECIPALIRNWFNNHVHRGDTGTVSKFVSNFISPILLNNEFQNLNESSKEFNNMIVKTRPVAREIAAVYTVDEVSMELVVQLGANHPLSPVSVNCGKRIGVSNSLWRQWMLQLNTFLSFQNGSILDGLALWKRNVDKRFEGVEECMVCFSVLHGSNYSLPTIACKTCKKKFHPACLYKWFNTSGKCTCPLCRNTF